MNTCKYRWILYTFFILTIVTSTLLAENDQGLTISPNQRRIIQKNGSVFFWLGDTAWELFHRLDREKATMYLKDRAEKGFTVIQAVVLAELDGLNTPNPYGHTPLIDNDPARPNESYFEHVDFIVNKAEEFGLTIGMLPTWGDKFNKKWGVGPEVFTPENAEIYGKFLGNRYKDKPIIWIFGGDRNPANEEDLAIIRAMAKGIQKGDGGVHLMTYHPQGGSKSWQWFHHDEWLDLNLFQSGHSEYDNPNYKFTLEGYNLTPVKPVLDGEPRYEDHPVNWDPQNDWFGAIDVRQAAYWSMLSGAAGHTYGNHNIWQMWEPDREPISSARTPWQEALEHVGAAQMGYMRKLFESRPFINLVPDQDIVAGRVFKGARHIRAARTDDGTCAIIYTPYGLPIEINMTKIKAKQARGYWYNPRTGEATFINELKTTGSKTFSPPGIPERGNDWLLILDAALESFPPPGDDKFKK